MEELGRPDGDAVEVLRELVAIYDAGRREPLPLPVKTSYAWAVARHSGDDPEQAAEYRWHNRAFGEDQLPAHVRAIEAEEIGNHVMHSEWAELSAGAAEVLSARRARGGRIVAVGTTAARTLRTTAAEGKGTLTAFTGNTSLFIRPGRVFRGLDASSPIFTCRQQLAGSGQRPGRSRADP